ncbi:hypothetical protein LOZ39_003096 [Ophidiomyces ophidiicola]|uniref:uncharacterized protein n=1 Tax=Ophidiomyces ophidiicola TaxID=1387563 RepID=UPI0020C44BA4|nr:uncharacterized protein LOZ57_004343 [Ophidiomyces ophidiicola]KAI1909422.1 hypothetical protein LOZ64_005251 [Ophidiomyces ophidiicola]KAI1914887.1 hypothetical protein LOZ61_002024 [Ophidiomyces ophidiicola]KAI1924785.1 hypothetical protein LOZ60_004517 [Ophidiomyces ophidiicola]KAI1945312.1 hypothetical protein LOZ57_004343 [Ophidiomyces ophidiicola]KAI1953192.1 hypothetical protein LOZ59_005234 [Ophidiomyces ophidiicola]
MEARRLINASIPKSIIPSGIRHCSTSISQNIIPRSSLYRSKLNCLDPASYPVSVNSLWKRTFTGIPSDAASTGPAKTSKPNTAPPRYNHSSTSQDKLSQVDSILRAISGSGQKSEARPERTPIGQHSRGESPWAQDIRSALNMYEKTNTFRGGLSTSKMSSAQFELRLSPSLGRTVAVDHIRGLDVAKAFVMMESRCAMNNIRNQEREQRYHVRKGLRKKEKRSQRWRKLFKAAFRAQVMRCQKLVKQGW